MKIYNLISDYLFLILILISSLLVYPLYFVSFSGYFGIFYFQVFTLSSISALSLSFIFLNYKKIFNQLKNNSELSISVFVIFFISAVHFFIFRTYSFQDFSFSVIWFSVPLIIYISSKCEKLFSIYFILIWCVDLIHTYFQTVEKVGIAGNRNWHAIFLLTLVIFSIYVLSRILKLFYYKSNKRLYFLFKILILLIFCILWVYSGYIIYLCNSRGASLAALASFLIFLFIIGKNKIFKGKEVSFSINKRIFFSFIIFLMIICFVVFFILIRLDLVNTGKHFGSLEEKILLQKNKAFNEIEDAFNRDVRIPLWIGTINLVIDNPLIGIGADRYETIFTSYRPISYFLKDMSATRTNHPHNVILYILACYGLPGFVFWAVLCFYPILYCFIRFRYLSLFEKCSLFSYFCLFLHACFDLIFYVWPTLFIGLLLLGVLWKVVWKSDPEIINKRQNYGIIFIFTGLIILFVTSYNVYCEVIGSANIRKGYYFEMRGNNDLALKYYNKGLEYIKPEKFIYKAGLVAFNDYHNPSLALKYFSYFNFIPTQNYAHNNGFIALCLMQKGDFNGAIPYLLKEVINYPLSTGAWYRLWIAQKTVGLTELAEFSYKNMLNTLKYKNLPKKALKYVLENPEYDKHPTKIPKYLLESL